VADSDTRMRRYYSFIGVGKRRLAFTGALQRCQHVLVPLPQRGDLLLRSASSPLSTR
jgi:hypothetical protein